MPKTLNGRRILPIRNRNLKRLKMPQQFLASPKMCPHAAKKSVAIVPGIGLAMTMIERNGRIETASIEGAHRKTERNVLAIVTGIEVLRDEAKIVKNEKVETDLDLRNVKAAREEVETIAIIAIGENGSNRDTNEIATDATNTMIIGTPRGALGTILIITQTIGVPEDLRLPCNADETSLEATETLVDHRATLMSVIHGVVILVHMVETGVLAGVVLMTFAALPVAIQALRTVEDLWTTTLLVETIRLLAIAIVIETAIEALDEIGIDVKLQLENY